LLCAALIAVAAAKLLWEASLLRHLLVRNMTSMRRSALLVTGELANVALARFALGALGGIAMPAFLLSHFSAEGAKWQPMQSLIFASVLFAACLAGEILERYLFFASVAGPRMPGGLR
jgi:hypothetical protein